MTLAAFVESLAQPAALTTARYSRLVKVLTNVLLWVNVLAVVFEATSQLPVALSL